MKKVMRKSIVILLAVAMLVSTLGNLSFPAFAETTDSLRMLVNGDFENGTAGFVVETAGYTDAVVSAVADETDTRSGKVLSISTGATAGTLHNFRVYQAVTVDANTDYVWDFYIQPQVEKNQYIGVVAGDTVSATGNTTLPLTYEVLEGDITFTPNNIAAGAQCALDGTADPNWLTFEANWTWKRVRIRFNSGENTSICLAYGARHTGRSVLFDDWSLYEVGKTINGNFEDSLFGFYGTAQTMEVVADPDNSANNVLHAIGGGYVRQIVAVKPNTNYVFSFRSKKVDTNGITYVDVYAEDQTTELVTDISHVGGYEAQFYNGRPNFNPLATWGTFMYTFNSGNNQTVYLNIEMWATNRDRYFDDWCLYEVPAEGELVNGDFENGLAGYVAYAPTYKGATVETIADPSNGRSGKVLSVSSGTSDGTLHAFTVYQNVKVAANTDYIWEFYIQDRNNSNHYIGVVAGDTVGLTGNTTLPVTATVTEGSIAFSSNTIAAGVQNTLDGAADPNWLTFGTDYKNTWKKVKISFNSGANTSICLAYGARAINRSVLFDDWSLEKAPLPGEIRNGDFENGLKYFVVSDKATAQISAEDVYAGTYSAKVNGLDGAAAFGQYIYQEVVVEPNTDYIWSFWYKSKANNTSLVGVRTADDKNLLPSFIKTDAFAVEADSSFTALRGAGDINQWHETLYDTEWKKYNVIFNSGDNTAVRLSIDLITSARGGFTDNWTLNEYTFMQGDADNDGAVDAKDLVEIRRHLLGKPSYYMGGIDVNGDGQFNIIDLIRFKKNFASLSPIAGYSLVWADDFGGQYLDDTKWTLAQHMSAQDDLELRYDETGVAVADGSATLYAGRVDEDSYYTNASLTTSNRDGSTHLMSFKYGYVEMRAKIPLGAPAFPSFWMKSVISNDMHGEIDIFEHFCYNGDTWIQSGIHKWYLDDSETHLLNNSIGNTNVPADGDWHTYGLLWTPEKLEFKLDGVTYHTIDISENLGSYTKYTNDNAEGEEITADNAIFHDYYYLIMNNYLYTPLGTDGADYAANSSSELPTEYEIDYVRLYQNSDGSIRLGALQ